MKTTINTGAFELRGIYQKYITQSLLMAGILHLMMIGGYRLYTYLTHDEIVFPINFPITIIKVLPPPPSLVDHTVLPTPILNAFEKPSIGTPVPVPDAEINPDITIPTQIQLNQLLPGADVGVTNGNTEYVIDGTTIENDEVPPDFRAVEKPPIAINQRYPQYPEIARRANIEGTVFVKMWVTKEGKVKKAEIAKTTSELFNQASIDAAMQWTFTPAIMNNGPVSVWVTVPFKFKLNNRN